MAGQSGEGRVLPSSSLMVSLRQEERRVGRRLAPLLAERGLLAEHWRIIAVLDDHPGTDMGTLSASAVVTAASLTRHVDRLVEVGIVVRHVDPADRRRVVLALSPQGVTYAGRLREAEAPARTAAATHAPR